MSAHFSFREFQGCFSFRYWIIVTPAQKKYATKTNAYKSVVLSVVGALFWAVGPVFGW